MPSTSRNAPAYCGLGLSGSKADQPGGLVGPQHREQGSGIIIPSGRAGVVAIPHLHLNLAGSGVSRRTSARSRSDLWTSRAPASRGLLWPVPSASSGRTMGLLSGSMAVARPPDGGADRLRAGSAGAQAGYHRRLVQLRMTKPEMA